MARSTVPQVPLYNTGARMVANYGTGPILDGMALFHAITSYCGDFAISATSCRAIMPDPDFYRQCLLDSFNELKAATDKLTAPTKPKREAAPRKAARKAVPPRSAARKAVPRSAGPPRSAARKAVLPRSAGPRKQRSTAARPRA